MVKLLLASEWTIDVAMVSDHNQTTAKEQAERMAQGSETDDSDDSDYDSESSAPRLRCGRSNSGR